MNDGGFGRTLSEELISTFTESEREELEHRRRRQEVFGISDFAVMLRHVEESYPLGVSASVHPSLGDISSAATTPVPNTKVFFSVISIVEGTQFIYIF